MPGRLHGRARSPASYAQRALAALLLSHSLHASFCCSGGQPSTLPCLAERSTHCIMPQLGNIQIVAKQSALLWLKKCKKKRLSLRNIYEAMSSWSRLMSVFHHISVDLRKAKVQMLCNPYCVLLCAFYILLHNVLCYSAKYSTDVYSSSTDIGYHIQGTVPYCRNDTYYYLLFQAVKYCHMSCNALTCLSHTVHTLITEQVEQVTSCSTCIMLQSDT